MICPDCKVELDPKVHLFCYRCGKTIEKIFSIVHKKQGKDVLGGCSTIGHAQVFVLRSLYISFRFCCGC